MNVDEFAVLAAGRALDALDPDDERAFQTALDEHPEWRGILDADLETAASLADGVEEVTPPAGIRDALLARIAQDASTDAADDTDDADPAAPDAADPDGADIPPSTEIIQTVQRRNWTRGLFALAASLVLLVALGFGAAIIGNYVYPPDPVQQTFAQIDGAKDAQTGVADATGGGTIEVLWSESVGKAIVDTTGLAQLPDDQTYQMWIIRGDAGPAPAGLFETDEAGKAKVVVDGAIQPNDTIAVTVEPSGGSTAPTTEPIVAIPTAA